MKDNYIEEVMETINKKALAVRDSDYCAGCGEYQEELRKALSEAYSRGESDRTEEILKLKQWVFTAPHGLEKFESKGKHIIKPRERKEEYYIKVSDLLQELKK